MTYKEAIKILFENTCIETVTAYHETPDFWEFVGECGGDSLRYRVYKSSGKVYEK